MKIILIPTILIFACSSTFAQDCKWQENKNDPISNTKYLKSKQLSKFVIAKESGGMSYFKSYLELKDGKVSICLPFETLPILSLEKIQQPSLVIRLEDTSKLILNTEEQFALNIQASVNRSSAALIWTLTKEDVQKMKTSPIKAMRISFAGHDYTYEIGDKQSKEFLQMFICMYQEL